MIRALFLWVLIGPIIALCACLLLVSLRRRRKIAWVNLRLCFPGLGCAQRSYLLVKVFHNVCLGILEGYFAWFAPKSMFKTVIEDETENGILSSARSDSGCIVLCPHYSCLEMVAPALASLLGRISMSYRPHEVPFVQKTLKRGRERFGRLINVRDIRGMIKALNEGERLWFGPDQDMGHKGSVFADFFGQPAATVMTPARLARITGAPVFFVRFRRLRFRYRFELVPFPKGYPFEDEVRNAAILNSFIEAALTDDPSQYMWLHRRFKTQPNTVRYSVYG